MARRWRRRRNAGNSTALYGYSPVAEPTGFGVTAPIGQATSPDDAVAKALAAWLEEKRAILETMEYASTNLETSSIQEKEHGKETAEGGI